MSENARRFAEDLPHLPIWKNGRRPDFWWDQEVRDFLIFAHRQMTIDQARSATEAKFGASRVPSRSTVGRFFKQLDEARKPYLSSGAAA